MSDKKLKILIFFTALSAGILLISNLAAAKLWDFFGIAVDGGIICFPISYILGDLIVEFYGRRTANRIIWASFLVNAIAALVFWAVVALPPYPGWEDQAAFATILGFVPRIIIGSLVAYVVSNLINNRIFTRIKSSNVLGSTFVSRALGSSAIAHIFDSAIFETIAFLGVLPFTEFLLQASFAYVAGLGLEIILSPLGVLAVHHLKKFIPEK